jgi:hypothetical protein
MVMGACMTFADLSPSFFLDRICFGRTLHGNDFVASVPDFDGVFKAPVQKWLKRAFRKYSALR